jgi:hypothetical protein
MRYQTQFISCFLGTLNENRIFPILQNPNGHIQIYFLFKLSIITRNYNLLNGRPYSGILVMRLQHLLGHPLCYGITFCANMKYFHLLNFVTVQIINRY